MDPEHKKYILENAGKKSVAEIAAEIGLRERNVRKVIRADGQKKRLAGLAAAAEPQAPPRPVSVKKAAIAISVALIIIMGFAVYANSLGGKFVYDDDLLIKDNVFIKGWPIVLKVFSADFNPFGLEKSAFYRPLQMITYAVDYRAWKLNVAGYHLTNILLHILAALCVYWLINILFRDTAVSVIAAVFFAVHPIHTVVVSYISTRADSLYLLFLLISFIFYIKSSRAGGALSGVIMAASYALALLSKENAVILPVLILLYHYAFREKVRLKSFVPIAGVALIYIALRMTVLRQLMTHVTANGTLIQRIPGSFAAFANYARLIFLPFGLHLEYGGPLFSFTDPEVICGLAIMAALIFCVFRARKTDTLTFFALSWFLITLVPVSNLYPLNAYMSENWLYLPSIGFFLALAGYLGALYKKEKSRIFALALAGCLLAFYSYLTIRQNETWADPILFYKRTLSYSPGSARTYNNLGVAYYKSGKGEDAIAAYKKALELKPDYATAYNNLANAYSDADRKEDAIAAYKKAIELNPGFTEAYYNLARTYYKMGRKDEAVAAYNKTLEINPGYAAAYNNLGIAYGGEKSGEDAIAMYKKAIDANPADPKAYNNLANAYDEAGRKDDAIAMYEKAIELNPDYALAYSNLASTFNDVGRRDEAIAMYKKAIGLNPYNTKAYNNLGLIYYGLEKKEDAIAMYKKAVELDPGFANAYNNLGVAYFAAGRRPDSAAAFRKALEINPGQADARRNLELISKAAQEGAPSQK